VLLLGETGSGKGVLARHVHDQSLRARGPFVELNCAGLSRELTESELFGYERGAFTGATARKLGLFEAADSGTLFLDEIGEMDAAVQAKLLKVLESRRFRRLGGTVEIEVDVRLVAATHRDLAADAAAGRFRSDLYYRLNVFAIPVPPLRERVADILPLARAFLAEYSGPRGLAPEAERALLDYRWPGNVRELRNVLERAAILCPATGLVGLEHLPPLPVASGEPASTALTPERDRLEAVLVSEGGNVASAARVLGMHRTQLRRLIARHGVRGARERQKNES
jgi:transcriptional regulator with GAF, ATPase, and Fis domain